MNMIKRFMLSIVGGAITAFGIASLINSGLGCFGITAAYIGLSRITGLPFSAVCLIVESLMIIYACYKREGIGVSSILACSYVGVLIDVFKLVLPTHPLMVIFGFCTMLGWAITAIGELGESATNLLTTVLVKQTGKSVTFIRTIIEICYLIVAIITAWDCLSIITLIAVFATGKILAMFYKLFKYDPRTVEHTYLIQLKKNKA